MRALGSLLAILDRVFSPRVPDDPLSDSSVAFLHLEAGQTIGL